MRRLLPRTLLAPLIRVADRASTAANERPTSLEETTRYPSFPWDLRTVIALFPEPSPWRFLNLNVTLGLTGVPFDQHRRWAGSSPVNAFDLQFCLEAGATHTAYKNYHTVNTEVAYRPDAVYLDLPGRLHFEGRWPDYEIEYRQPEADLSIRLTLRSLSGFQWWAYSPRIYCHYTTFCRGSVRWNRGGDDEGTCDLTVLHDHGWGKNILPLRLPLKVFRYEVMGLPDGGFAIALWTEGPAGLELRNIGLIRPEGGPLAFMRAYSCQVLDWDTFENYEGQPCRVPRRWAGTLEGRAGRFVYETERETEPRPVLGEGFLYASRYCGRFQGKGLDQLGLAGKEVAGRGYVEHIARFAGRGN